MILFLQEKIAVTENLNYHNFDAVIKQLSTYLKLFIIEFIFKSAELNASKAFRKLL